MLTTRVLMPAANLIVGAVVIMIVVTAGMVSTTWVQFLKGSLLVVFSAILTWMILERGFEVKSGGGDGHEFRRISVLRQDIDSPGPLAAMSGWDVLPRDGSWAETKHEFVRLKQADTGQVTAWLVEETNNAANVTLVEAQTRVAQNGQPDLVNGLEKGIKAGEPQLHPVGWVKSLPDGQQKTGPLSMPGFFRTMQQSEVVVWRNEKVKAADGSTTTVYYPKTTPGSEVLRPGEHPKFAGIRGDDIKGKLNFLSLMLALFCGTASLPHILIRYYTVKDESSARKSTIVGIASIGFFYVLTLYLGLGAMTSGAMDVTDSNMAAPLLAKSMNTWLFAAISAIAFTTVLGTVSGLILASAGAVTHDLLSSSFGWEMSDHEKVRVAKISSVIVGAIAIVLGILFEGINVGYLVGWAFSVAASANLPALVMILFWKRVTSQGVIAAILVGMVSSLGWILLSSDTFETVYGLPAQDAWTPFTQPGIVTIPLGFLTLIVVSLMTKGHQSVETA